MTPEKIKGSNGIITLKANSEFNSIPVIKVENDISISCWSLSDAEIEEIIKTKKLYLSHCIDSNNVLHGISPMSRIDDFYTIKEILK